MRKKYKNLSTKRWKSKATNGTKRETAKQREQYRKKRNKKKCYLGNC